MRREVATSVVAVVVITLLLGVAYPLAITGIGQVAFRGKANGSLIERNGRVVGSRLIGQDFGRNPRWFQGRPSTATRYAADSSGFTNLGPNSRKARDTFRSSLAAYLALERPFNPGLTAARVPIDAVTSSASGIDPHISVANARIQAHRVGSVRGLPPATVSRLVDAHTSGRLAGIFGEPAVNVLELNLALDAIER